MRPEPASLLQSSSIEVTPRSFARLGRAPLALPPGSEVFIAHIEGTDFADMLATARSLRAAGMEPVPHLPARLIADASALQGQLRAYRDAAGVGRALLIAGGRRQPLGNLSSSLDLIGTGHFDRFGFTHLYFAGHPEGNSAIDPRGGSAITDAALISKQALAQRSDAQFGLVTQFLFDEGPVIAWAQRLHGAGIDLPIRVGLAGPARLQSLIRFALDCGVGASVGVLQRRARDLRKLLVPITPDALIAALDAHRAEQPETLISGLHLFPFGGIAGCLDWLAQARAQAEPRRWAGAAR